MSINNSKKNQKKNFIGNNLKKLRYHHNLTLDAFSKKSKKNLKTIQNYEANIIIPSLTNLAHLSNYFGITIDFLLLWNKTDYPKNLELIKLAKKLDVYSQPQERTHIEVTAKSLLKQKDNDSRIKVRQDVIDIKLTSNIHENIRLLKENKNVLQKEIAEYLGVNQSQIAHYQNKSTPPADRLIKLSEYFNISIHAIATGEKLYFTFKDGHFGKTIFLADKLLSLEHQKFLIELMENIINDGK